MSNIEKAAESLYAHRQSVGDFPEGLTAWEELPEAWREEWREAAQALADAGLIAPDLPSVRMPDGQASGGDAMTEFKKGMWVMVAWGGKGDEHPALVIDVRSNGLEVIDLGVNQVLGVPFDWATPMDMPRICDDDGQPLYWEWEEN